MISFKRIYKHFQEAHNNIIEKNNIANSTNIFLKKFCHACMKIKKFIFGVNR